MRGSTLAVLCLLVLGGAAQKPVKKSLPNAKPKSTYAADAFDLNATALANGYRGHDIAAVQESFNNPEG